MLEGVDEAANAQLPRVRVEDGGLDVKYGAARYIRAVAIKAS